MRVTAETAMGDSVEEYCDTIFEFKDVVAARNRLVRSFNSTGVDISVRYSTAFSDAFVKASAMTVGCIPFSKRFSAAPRNAPAKTTTVVVPSPASISCAAERSASYVSVNYPACMKEPTSRTICPAGCNALMFFIIVAPSLVTIVSPFEV